MTYELSDLPERIASKIQINPDTGCWGWRRAKHPRGYAHIWWEGKVWNGHTLTYLLLVGPVPEGTELDHTCRVTCCINPSHLEPVTHRINVLRGESPSAQHARKTHCVNNHPLPDDRICRPCRAADARARRLRQRQAVAA